MFKGLRKQLTVYNSMTNKEGKLYIVKTKRWPKNKLSIRSNSLKANYYIIGHPSRFRNWHKKENWQMKMSFLHELGHLAENGKEKYHWQRELWVSIYGFVKYRKEFALCLKIRHLLTELITNYRYYLFNKTD